MTVLFRIAFFGFLIVFPAGMAASQVAAQDGEPTETTQPPIIVQQAPDAPDDSIAKTGVLPGWAEMGLAGLIFVGFVSKQIVPGWQYSDRSNELRESRSNESRLIQQVLDTQRDVLPALQASTTAQTAMSQALDRLTIEMKERRDHGGIVQ